jgi:hypothetical protein
VINFSVSTFCFLNMRLTFTTLALATAGLLSFPQSVEAQTVYGLEALTDVRAFMLFSFNATSPGILSPRTLITGLNGATLLGIERRPATGQLLTLAYYSSATPQMQLFELNPTTAVATPVGPAFNLVLSNFSGKIGFSIDPATDLVRVVTPAGSNFRLSPVTGSLVGTDSNLAYASNDTNFGQAADLQAITFTNNYSGSTNSQLLGIDRAGSRLVRQAQATTGVLTTIGPLGISLPSSGYQLDLGSVTNQALQTSTLYLMTGTYTGQFTITTNWYTINPATGAATLVGTIGQPNDLPYIMDVAMPNAVVTATRDRAELAAAVSLYPNPATSATGLSFHLSQTGSVGLCVTDALGRNVETTPAIRLAAGPQTLRWNTAIPAGMYLVRLLVDGQVAAQRPLVVAE